MKIELPDGFDLIEARHKPFSGRIEHASPSRKWIVEQAGILAATFEGLPCGVARLILDEAADLIKQAADRVATSTEFGVWKDE